MVYSRTEENIKYLYIFRKYFLYFFKFEKKTERLMYRKIFFDYVRSELDQVDKNNLRILELDLKMEKILIDFNL